MGTDNLKFTNMLSNEIMLSLYKWLYRVSKRV